MLARMATAEETGRAEAVRGVLHGAMALYLARHLNVPPARIPGDGDDRLADLPSEAEGLCAALLDAFDGSGRSISRRVLWPAISRSATPKKLKLNTKSHFVCWAEGDHRDPKIALKIGKIGCLARIGRYGE